MSIIGSKNPTIHADLSQKEAFSIAIDPRVNVPPLTGIATVAQVLQEGLVRKGYTVQLPTLPYRHRMQNMVWRSPSLLKRFFPADRAVEGAQIFHALWPFSPLPLFTRTKTVYTVHDLIPLHSEWRSEYTARQRRLFERDLHHALMNATGIHFVSEFTKNDTLSHFNIPFDEKRMRVAHLGVAQHFFVEPSKRDTETPKELRDLEAALIVNTDTPLSQGFCFTLGSVLPHKNIQQLIDAYDESFPPLLIVGAASSELNITKQNIVQTGYVHEETLLWIMDNADCMIFPSLHEGFGLPPLEAMARACPVIASSSTSIPEVLGSAALLIDCRDTQMLKTAIDRMLSSKEMQLDYQKRGLEHVKQFTSEALALRLEPLYRSALSSS